MLNKGKHGTMMVQSLQICTLKHEPNILIRSKASMKQLNLIAQFHYYGPASPAKTRKIHRKISFKTKAQFVFVGIFLGQHQETLTTFVPKTLRSWVNGMGLTTCIVYSSFSLLLADVELLCFISRTWIPNIFYSNIKN